MKTEIYRTSEGNVSLVTTFADRSMKEHVLDEVIKAVNHATKEFVYNDPEMRKIIAECVKIACLEMSQEVMYRVVKDAVRDVINEANKNEPIKP